MRETIVAIVAVTRLKRREKSVLSDKSVFINRGPW
jgi:hypothetical protein